MEDTTELLPAQHSSESRLDEFMKATNSLLYGCRSHTLLKFPWASLPSTFYQPWHSSQGFVPRPSLAFLHLTSFPKITRVEHHKIRCASIKRRAAPI
jgi:hypothetical protein